MIHSAYLLENFAKKIKNLGTTGLAVDLDVVQETVNYIEKELLNKLTKAEASWKDFAAFWPPRYVKAIREGEAIIFFGAGLSFPCGIPSWNQLLSDRFNLEKAFIEDEDLQADPLTLAELAGQFVGNEALQDILRNIMNHPRGFSVNHAALAALRVPAYVTTNYDCLFEKAWKEINGGIDLVVVTNDGDIATPVYQDALTNGSSFLFKIHGSSDRLDEHMILTRRDYRYHYRINDNLFQKIRELLRTKHTLFVGFSHKDPEVSRLVEDAIYDFERNKGVSTANPSRPQFYSLQFDMRAHTPEVFAARGIVALTPPVISSTLDNLKSKALATALTDLIGAKEKNLHSKVSLDNRLHDAVEKIGNPINDGLNKIGSYNSLAKELLAGQGSRNWLLDLCRELGSLASQGVYLLDDQGNVADFELISGLDRTARQPTRSFSQRAYFQQAKSFRQPFVSDTTDSIYTGQATFFLCVPLLTNGQMIGLLFSASQVGQWDTPITVAKNFWKDGISLLLIDSNGIVLLPPMDEFHPKDASIKGANEINDANLGYSYERLLGLSRRDMLVRHISKSVIPITQDDDVLNLWADVRQFTIVSEVPNTRWKLGVSLSMRT